MPDTYVIFIFDFPLSKTPLYRYTYRNICRENGECLEDGCDGCATIFLSTCGENEADVPKALVDFLKYVKEPRTSPAIQKKGSYEASVERQVERIKRDREMEAQYMMLEEMLKDEREAGRKEGHETGRNEGLKIGRLEGEKIGEQRGGKQSLELANELVSRGRYGDLKRCLEDEICRVKLLEEFGLKSKE